MKSKILFICCFILLLCGCSKKEDTKTEELLTNNDIGFTIIVEDGRGITKDSKINHINDYIGDQYIESKKNNDTVYYNDSIQITLNKKNKVKIVGDSFTGVFKYVKNKKVYVKMSEYESEKINFFDKTSNVLNVKGNMLSYKYDEELFTKYFNYEEVNIVDYINDRIYFIYKDNLYNYYEGKINYLGHYFEFNFNKNSNVFVYNK